MKTALEVAKDHKQFYGKFVDQKMAEGPKGRLLKEILDEAETASDNNLADAIKAYAREAIAEHLERAAENAKTRTPNMTVVDKDSIRNIEIKLP